ncbi:MAG: hypothetical protein AAGM22_26450 [Acidobacteriota bacterium]
MNDLFSFILTMVSLVLAIGVTHLVQDAARLVRQRRDVELEPVVFVWVASLFLVGALYWWSLWDFRGAEWRFPLFFYMLLAPTLFHIAASLLVSSRGDGAAEEGGESQFERIRVPFMVIMAMFSVIVMGDGWVVGVEPGWTEYRPLQLWSVAIYLIGAAVSSSNAQYLLAWLALVTYVVAGFFYRLLPGAFGG